MPAVSELRAIPEAAIRRRFRAAGFAIESDIDFGYLLAHGSACAEPADVVVSLGDAPTDKGLSFRRERFGFTALDGRRIHVAVRGARAHAVSRTVLTAGLNAIAYQRGLLPLHASAVAVGGGCIAFCGESDAGKSTIAGLLARAGYPCIADDLVVLHPDGSGAPPMVWPSARLNLDGRSLAWLGDDARAITPAADWDGKAIASVGDVAAYAPRRLDCLYLLSWGEPGARRLRPAEALPLLDRCLRSSGWLAASGAATTIRQRWLDFVARTPIVQLARRRTAASPQPLAQALIAAWRAGSLAPSETE